MSWLVYRLTQSAFWLGVVEFAAMFTSFLLMPYTGYFLDKYDVRKILIITQILGFIQAVAIGIMTLMGIVQIWHVVIFSVLIGITNAFDMPGRHSIVPGLIEKKRYLINAIALNSSIFNAARLIGPSIAGVAVAALGESLCFIVNGISFLPNAFVLMRIKLKEKAVLQKPAVSFRSGMMEGLEYAMAHRIIGPMLFLLVVTSLMGMSFVVMMPVYASEILKGGAETLGFLMGALGLGALVGALSLAMRSNPGGLHRLVPKAFGWFGIGLFLLASTENVVAAMICMVFIGFWMVTGWSGANTLFQTSVEDDKRSRVMSLYLMCYTGMAPIGSLILGYLTGIIGLSLTFHLSGFMCAGASLLYYLKMKRDASDSGEME